jgi:translation initiation factor IF-2
MSELTAPEAAAARGHMELCRDCSAAHTARVQARRRLRVAVPAAGGTAAAGGVWSALAGGASSVVGPAAGGAAAAALGGLALIGPGLSDTRQPAGPPEAEPPAVAAVAADRATDPVVGRRGDSQDRGDAKTAPSTGGTPTAAPAAPGQAPAPAAPDPRAPGGGATTTPVGRVTPPPSSQPLLPSIPPTGTPKPGPTVSLPPPLPTVTLPSLPQPLPTSLPDPVSVVTSAVPVPLPTISVEVSLPLP